ncbi:hypothetical protein WN51_13064 [Melipona quadrifasciata]|uniref:Uncharacterized protein n=1 Tax=Melipona quadrifasciata TaxID=166423 RepID=A0A0M9A039_9HYME|nr:hypothetical protein WN51_13064 [Melipona quadrifasciata]
MPMILPSLPLHGPSETQQNTFKSTLASFKNISINGNLQSIRPRRKPLLPVGALSPLI